MDNLTLNTKKIEENSISFYTSNNIEPIILLKNNGDIFIKGKLIENDIELVNALREFLKERGYLK